jgi:alpha-L-rhamnosidase
MKRGFRMKATTFILVILMASIGSQNTSSAQLKPTALRCEYLTNPLSVDVASPRLSWIIESKERGVLQTAYEVLVASSERLLNQNHGDVWESGKVETDQSNQVLYAGLPLVSRATCYWKVRVWDNHGHVSNFSRPAMWRMGLLLKADWKTQWIGLKAEPSADLRPAPYVRKEFVLTKSLRRAFAYITARGMFIASINGNRIGKEYLSPEWSDYKKRIQYFTYDVTSQIRKGINCAGIIIGDGWYKGYVGFALKPNNYGDQTSALLQLHLEYSDGTEEIVGTDETWKGWYGPILYSDMLMGESYDARREMRGWNKPGFDDSHWQSVEVFPAPEVRLVPLRTEPVRMTQLLKPKKITEPTEGKFVVDFGQNFAGFCRFKVRGQAGMTITLRHAEVLNPDGTIYTTNLRRAKATETYFLQGGREEVLQPHFTFHGFRYVEITGLSKKPRQDAILGCVINTDLPTSGTFACSDAMVNQLVSNILWSQRGNFISIPTDCPQRDERLGWMGDAQIFVRTASFNMDVASFMNKWMIDVEDSQSPQGAFKDTNPYLDGLGTDGAPGWGDAGVIIPWYIYRCYGDKNIIEQHYDAMTRWMRYLEEGNPNHIRKNRLNNNYGDWLSINAETPKDLLATAFWAYDAHLMADMAKAVGKDSDARYYQALFDSVRAAFQKTYIALDGQVEGKTQTGYVLALAFNLMPQEMRGRAAELLVKDIQDKGNHLSTGFIGVKYLNPVLTESGNLDLAYRLLFNTTFPSWGYPITAGATTIWERWDGWTTEKGFQDPGMNSFNHYSMGSVGEWLYRFVAGIDLDPDVSGYKRVILHPRPSEKLKNARAEYISIYGAIKVDWTRQDGKFALKVAVPPNTIGEVYVPATDPDSVREGGKPAKSAEGVKYLRTEDGCAVFEVGSGEYIFESL